MGVRANVVTAASANGIFIDLFSPNGWLLQIFVVSALDSFRNTLAPIIVAYPLIILVELISIALVDLIGSQRALVLAYFGRMIAISLLLGVFGYYQDQTALFVAYYATFAFHVVGFHVAWPQFVRCAIPAIGRGEVLGQARATAGGVSIVFLTVLYLLSHVAPERIGFVALLGAILISIVSFVAVAQPSNFTHNLVSVQPSQEPRVNRPSLVRLTIDLAKSSDFRSAMLQTCALSLGTVPLPLIFMEQTMAVPMSSVIFALLAALVVSTILLPRFGRYIDRDLRRAYFGLLFCQLGTMATVLLSGLLINRVSQMLVIVLCTASISINAICARFAGLLTYKRALDLGSPRVTAVATTTITWTFDLALWLVATVTVLSLTSGLAPSQSATYSAICGAAAAAAALVSILELKALKDLQ